ncbi:hypothetical protein HK100_008105 [Physocladia obscura]|uniref:RING-type domain-containing protein n=1 Tax=Physocladia obscura TaxID=109957 RepID=A0AAD5XI84_9FUNG|nr:hypothetical protein HK100_008105 [Physocladia obscura]
MKAPPSLVCKLCGGFLRKPARVEPCGHHFCGVCIASQLSHLWLCPASPWCAPPARVGPADPAVSELCAPYRLADTREDCGVRITLLLRVSAPSPPVESGSVRLDTARDQSCNLAVSIASCGCNNAVPLDARDTNFITVGAESEALRVVSQNSPPTAESGGNLLGDCLEFHVADTIGDASANQTHESRVEIINIASSMDTAVKKNDADIPAAISQDCMPTTEETRLDETEAIESPQGTNMTESEWTEIVQLGSEKVSEVIKQCRPALFDPCRDDMAGFKHGSADVVKVLSRAIDKRYSSKCVLWEAAYGDGVALTYVVRLGEMLVHDLKRGDYDRVMVLLDAGAVVLDEGMLAAAVISESPPGDWNAWQHAACCYRRVLVQRRLGLPIPSMDTINRLSQTAVTEAFLMALFSTRPIYCNPSAANVYSLYQRRRHPNTNGVKIILVPVLEYHIAERVIETAMDSLRKMYEICNDPFYPGESYCFIKGMLQCRLREKDLFKGQDEFFFAPIDWPRVVTHIVS